MDSKVVYAKLLEKEEDSLGYITYVFEILEKDDIGKYVMCVQFPNWDHKPLYKGDIGYLYFKEVIAGIDKWWDGNSFIPYNYSNWIFIKFITETKQQIDKLIKTD